MSFLTEAGQRAIEDGVEAIEAVSAAEIVVAIRPRARHSLIQHAVVGIVAAIAMLAFTLYSPIEFALWHILVLPVFAGLLGALLVEAVPPLYRFVEPPWLRYEHVREAAYAAFVERGVHATRDRTGVLIYVAVRERMVEVVGDLAVVNKLGIEVLAAMAGTLEAHVARGSASFGKALGEQAAEFAKALPRRADDVDELSNTVHVFGAPPRQRKAVS
jgi:putative membrane protein